MTGVEVDVIRPDPAGGDSGSPASITRDTTDPFAYHQQLNTSPETSKKWKVHEP